MDSDSRRKTGHKTKGATAISLAVGLCAAIAAPAAATTWLPHDLTSQLQASPLVFEGRVEQVYPCPDAPTGLPRTCSLMSVQHVDKGRIQSGRVIVVLPGGVLADGRSVRMAGAPTLSVGDEVMASATVMVGSDSMVALSNFDTALLRKVTSSDPATAPVAADANGRALLALPLQGQPTYAPTTSAGGGVPAAPADSIPGQPPRVPPPPVTLPVLTWQRAVQTVVDGINATVGTSSSVPPANIRGATAN